MLSVTIEDLGSSNGTFASGLEITGVQRIDDGVEVEFAGSALWLHVGTPAEEAPVELPSHDDQLSLLEMEIRHARNNGQTSRPRRASR